MLGKRSIAQNNIVRDSKTSKNRAKLNNMLFRNAYINAKNCKKVCEND